MSPEREMPCVVSPGKGWDRFAQRGARRRREVARARILVADDHKEMRDKVILMLEREFEVLEPVKDGRELLEAASRLNPNVCIVDISMPMVSGIEASVKLLESGLKAKIIFLTMHDEPDYLAAAFKAGAAGYVIKSRMMSDLPVAINEVMAGHTFVSSFNSGAKKVETDESL
jgi:DNA-binding NarL/FixJ family response regulator